jgi:hypothetical protein
MIAATVAIKSVISRARVEEEPPKLCYGDQDPGEKPFV